MTPGEALIFLALICLSCVAFGFIIGYTLGKKR